MKKHISFQPERTLRSKLRKPGGVTMEQAVARANGRLEAMRDAKVSAVDEMILALATDMEPVSTDADMYFEITDIYALAGSFGLRHVGQAAKSLCELIEANDDADEEMVVSDKRAAALKNAVRVHVESLKALRRPEMLENEAGRELLVTGLESVVAHLAVCDA